MILAILCDGLDNLRNYSTGVCQSRLLGSLLFVYTRTARVVRECRGLAASITSAHHNRSPNPSHIPNEVLTLAIGLVLALTPGIGLVLSLTLATHSRKVSCKEFGLGVYGVNQLLHYTGCVAQT